MIAVGDRDGQVGRRDGPVAELLLSRLRLLHVLGPNFKHPLEVLRHGHQLRLERDDDPARMGHLY